MGKPCCWWKVGMRWTVCVRGQSRWHVSVELSSRGDLSADHFLGHQINQFSSVRTPLPSSVSRPTPLSLLPRPPASSSRMTPTRPKRKNAQAPQPKSDGGQSSASAHSADPLPGTSQSEHNLSRLKPSDLRAPSADTFLAICSISEHRSTGRGEARSESPPAAAPVAERLDKGWGHLRPERRR